MNEKIDSPDRGDLLKALLLVVAALGLLMYFLTAFPTRVGLDTYSVEDPTGNLELPSVLNLPADAWKDNQGRTASAGYTDSTYWVKTKLPVWTEGERLLVLNFPLIEHITVYRIQMQTGLMPPIEMGAARPFGDRQVLSDSFVVELSQEDSEANILLKVRTQTSMQIPLELWTRDEFDINRSRISLFHGAYVGVVFAMLVYNLLLFAVIRETAYLWYIGWIASMSMFVITVNGNAFQWLWPNSPALNLITLPISLSIAVACVAGFFIHFLREGAHRQPREWWFRGFGFASLGVAVLSILVPYRFGIVTAIFMAMLIVFSIIVEGVRQALRGNVAARYAVMAFSFVVTGGVVLAMNKFGLIPRTFATEYAAELGSAMEMVVLSLVIIVRFNGQRREREKIQAQLLRSEQALIQDLEARVAARTEELNLANNKLLELSHTDPLTGVFNRRYFDERLHAELRRADRKASSMAVLMIDIDYFKKINDTHGHHAGDLCLQAVAGALIAGSQRPSDMVARYGGEEFLVIAPDINAKGAETLAENLRVRVEGLRVPFGEATLTVTISIGLFWRTSGNELSGQEILEAADQAMYRAKENGRNRVVKA